MAKQENLRSLEAETRAAVDTATAAFHLNRKAIDAQDLGVRWFGSAGTGADQWPSCLAGRENQDRLERRHCPGENRPGCVDRAQRLTRSAAVAPKRNLTDRETLAPRGARHNGDCHQPAGRAAVPAPSAPCARLRHLMAIARYVELRSNSPGDVSQVAPGSMPGATCFAAPREALGCDLQPAPCFRGRIDDWVPGFAPS